MFARSRIAEPANSETPNWLGAETFVSFDKKAVTLLAKQRYETRLLH